MSIDTQKLPMSRNDKLQEVGRRFALEIKALNPKIPDLIIMEWLNLPKGDRRLLSRIRKQLPFPIKHLEEAMCRAHDLHGKLFYTTRRGKGQKIIFCGRSSNLGYLPGTKGKDKQSAAARKVHALSSAIGDLRRAFNTVQSELRSLSDKGHDVTLLVRVPGYPDDETMEFPTCRVDRHDGAKIDVFNKTFLRVSGLPLVALVGDVFVPLDNGWSDDMLATPSMDITTNPFN